VKEKNRRRRKENSCSVREDPRQKHAESNILHNTIQINTTKADKNY
jgi:hypothetical protein